VQHPHTVAAQCRLSRRHGKNASTERHEEKRKEHAARPNRRVFHFQLSPSLKVFVTLNDTLRALRVSPHFHISRRFVFAARPSPHRRIKTLGLVDVQRQLPQ
jgi:hypothetical protein